jgi:DNA-binding beta-propeller fold protein YncE
MRIPRTILPLSLLAVAATSYAYDEAAPRLNSPKDRSIFCPEEDCFIPGFPIQFQAYDGESDRGPLFIYNSAIPSLSDTVPTPIASGTTRRSVGGLAVSPDSTTVWVGDLDSDRVMRFDAATRTFSGSTLNAGGRTHGLAAGPTGRFLYVAVGNTPATYALTVIDLTGVLPNLSIPLNARPLAVAVTPNNSYVVVTLGSSQAAVINIGTPHTFRAYVPLSGRG